MKRLLSIAGGLLGLLALGALVVALALLFGGLGRSTEPASQAFQSPIETPTQLPYPPSATPTRPLIPTIPPTVTRAPKPSPSSTPIPTATLAPTPLSLPPSAFYALWAENYPEGQGSILWLADPRDIGSRREVLRFERDAIAEAALSPNGRKLALVTTYWKTATLWVANVDGTDLQQLDQAAALGGLFWSRDSRSLAYSIGWREEVMMPSEKTGTPGPVPMWRGAIELLDVATGEKRRLLETGPDMPLSILGWSADGRELYYSISVLRETGYGYELWAVGQSGQEAHRITPVGHEPVPLVLAPDGSKLLVGTSEGWAWMSADGQTRQDIPMPSWRQRCGLIWSANENEVVLCQVDEQQPIEHIKVVNLRTGATRGLGSFGVPSSGIPFSPLAVSPDMQWITTSADGIHYWGHLPTGMIVTVPRPNRGSVLHVAWIPRQAGR